MREIKFRAYIKSIKKILPVIDISFGVDGLISDIQVSGCGEEGCRTCNDFYESDDFIIMQYTGLKDTYDKEIYEGDIVYGHYIEYDPYFDKDNTHIFTSDIKYINNSFKVNRDTVNEEGRIRNYGYLHEWDNQRVAVIGNIYDTPEYLKEEE